MLLAFHKSHNTIVATLTDVDGLAVTGATVTVTIKDKAQTALATDQPMVDQADGTYEFVSNNSLLPTEDEIYKAEITAVSGGNTRYAEVAIKNILDMD